MAVRPIVREIESAKAAPTLSIMPFHEIKMMTGTNNAMITERRLRHCVIKSARIKDLKAMEGLGIFGCIAEVYL
jgi:Lon protease-like protein